MLVQDIQSKKNYIWTPSFTFKNSWFEKLGFYISEMN